MQQLVDGDMGRNWVLGAAVVGILVGVLFAVFPQWDLQVVQWFWDPVTHRFPLATKWTPNLLRKIADWIIWLILLVSIGSFAVKLAFPQGRMLLRPTIALFLLASYALGPGLVTNGILKPVWARSRPISVEQFEGQQQFAPWWKPGGDCKRNCSFVSGDASTAFWLLAPASVAPPPLKPLALAGATIIGTGISGLRVAFGRHFLTDVVFSGVLTIFVIVLCQRFILRMQDIRIEQGIERLALLLRSPLRSPRPRTPPPGPESLPTTTPRPGPDRSETV